jgi:hypothetical protein
VQRPSQLLNEDQKNEYNNFNNNYGFSGGLSQGKMWWEKEKYINKYNVILKTVGNSQMSSEKTIAQLFSI